MDLRLDVIFIFRVFCLAAVGAVIIAVKINSRIRSYMSIVDVDVKHVILVITSC